MTAIMTASAIVTAVSAVRARIAAACERAGREPSAVTLVGVTKTRTAEEVVAACAAGIGHLGENRVQEGAAKAQRVAELLGNEGLPEWRLIGHLQTNKVRAAIGTFDVIETIDSPRVAEMIAAHAVAPLRVFVEVNVSGEPAKGGVAPGELSSLLREVRSLPPLTATGLMTVAPLTRDLDRVRGIFRRLRELAQEHGLPELSMGMSNDFEIAIEEGATSVRIGRAIFGERQA